MEHPAARTQPWLHPGQFLCPAVSCGKVRVTQDTFPLTPFSLRPWATLLCLRQRVKQNKIELFGPVWNECCMSVSHHIWFTSSLWAVLDGATPEVYCHSFPTPKTEGNIFKDKCLYLLLKESYYK